MVFPSRHRYSDHGLSYDKSTASIRRGSSLSQPNSSCTHPTNSSIFFYHTAYLSACAYRHHFQNIAPLSPDPKTFTTHVGLVSSTKAYVYNILGSSGCQIVLASVFSFRVTSNAASLWCFIYITTGKSLYPGLSLCSLLAEVWRFVQLFWWRDRVCGVSIS